MSGDDITFNEELGGTFRLTVGSNRNSSFTSPEPPKIMFYSNNQLAVCFDTATGRFTVGEGLSTDEATQVFARAMISNFGPTPTYVFDPQDWEATYTWKERDDLITERSEWNKVHEFATLYEGPTRFAVHHWTEDVNEVRWYDTREEAEAAVAAIKDVDE